MLQTNVSRAVEELRQVAGSLTIRDPAVRSELDLLFAKASADPPMAVVRSRRLLEVLATDFYVRELGTRTRPPDTLAALVSHLVEKDLMSHTMMALCDGVRCEGNRVVHYTLGDAKGTHILPADIMIDTLRRIAELAEHLAGTGNSTYLAILDGRFASMYHHLCRAWRDALAASTVDNIPVFDVIEMVFRSVTARMQAEWLDVLVKYADDGVLHPSLPPHEEHILRQLRNLSLIEHDGPWLFEPTRSTDLVLTPSGRVLLHLSSSSLPGDLDKISRGVARRFAEMLADRHAAELLKRLRKSPHIAEGEKRLLRKMRNLHLIVHPTTLLASADEVRLTDLGYYVVGRYEDDQ